MIDQATLARLVKLADWHEQNALHPIDVSGSDRARAERKRFNTEAAADIRAAVGTLDPGFRTRINLADIRTGR